jgi:hypothetical protein
MMFLTGLLLGAGLWFLIRCVIGGFYTVGPSERAVKTSFGRADRIEGASTLSDPVSESLKGEERAAGARDPAGRAVLQVALGEDPQGVGRHGDHEHGLRPGDPNANKGGTVLEAVTKDQLNTGLNGQIRYRVSEQNLYAYLFGVKRPLVHVMGYFVSILRERIANFEAPHARPAGLRAERGWPAVVRGISINDLRKNLRDAERAHGPRVSVSEARYGIASTPRSSPASIRPPRSSPRWPPSTRRTTRCRRTSAWRRPRPTRRSCSRAARWRSRRSSAQAEVEPLVAAGRQLSRP